MSDSEEIYESPAAPTPAHQSKVAQLARAFELTMKPPTAPKPVGHVLPEKSKKAKLLLPVAVSAIPNMEVARKCLRPVSSVPEAIAAHAQPPIDRNSDVDRRRRTRSDIRESLYPPEMGPKEVGPAEAEVGASSPPSALVARFRMIPLPPEPEVTRPSKPDVIDVDLEPFRCYVTYASDDIYDDVIHQSASRDSDFRVASTIPDMTEDDELNEQGTRGTIFEEIPSEPEEWEEEQPEEQYDDIMAEDLYQHI